MTASIYLTKPMHISIVYATYSGSTMTASQLLTDELVASGVEVQQLLAAETSPEQLQHSDLIIFGSPSWDYKGKQGMPHEDFEGLMQRFAGHSFPDKKTAIFGLGDSNYTHYCGAVVHLQTFVEQLKLKELVEPLKIDQFYVDEVTHTQAIKDWAKQILTALSAA